MNNFSQIFILAALIGPMANASGGSLMATVKNLSNSFFIKQEIDEAKLKNEAFIATSRLTSLFCTLNKDAFEKFWQVLDQNQRLLLTPAFKAVNAHRPKPIEEIGGWYKLLDSLKNISDFRTFHESLTGDQFVALGFLIESVQEKNFEQSEASTSEQDLQSIVNVIAHLEHNQVIPNQGTESTNDVLALEQGIRKMNQLIQELKKSGESGLKALSQSIEKLTAVAAQYEPLDLRKFHETWLETTRTTHRLQCQEIEELQEQLNKQKEEIAGLSLENKELKERLHRQKEKK